MATALRRAGTFLVTVYPALSHSSYRVYWGSTLFSLTGMWMFSMAQGWLVLSLTNSALMLGLVGACFALPNLLLSLVGGAIADRIDRRRLLFVTRVLSLLVLAALAGLIAIGRIEVWHVFAFTALQGCIAAFDMPTTQAMVPTLVRPAAITSAIALVSASFNGTRIIGPSIAGVLVAEIGIAGCYAIGAISSVPVLIALATIRPVTDYQRATDPFLASIKRGFAYVRRDRLRVTILGLFLVNSLFGMAYAAMMPVFARDVLAAGPQAFGALMASSGAGSLVGTMLVATLASYPRKGLAALVCAIGFGLALIAFAFSPDLTVALILMATVALFNSTYSTLLSTILQTDLDDQYRGRVMSIFTLIMNMMPLSGLLAGALATGVGAPVAIAFTGAVVAVVGAIAFVRAPWLRQA